MKHTAGTVGPVFGTLQGQRGGSDFGCERDDDLATATVTTKGQVTIPLGIRRAMGISEGDRLLFEMDSGVLKIRKLSPLDVLVSVVRESFPTPEDFDDYLRANRKKLFESLYGTQDAEDSEMMMPVTTHVPAAHGYHGGGGQGCRRLCCHRR